MFQLDNKYIQTVQVKIMLTKKYSRMKAQILIVLLIKGPRDKPIKLVVARTMEKGKRKKIEVNLIRNTFVIPEQESCNQLNIREFLRYGFPQ